jgi:hypothetical protein
MEKTKPENIGPLSFAIPLERVAVQTGQLLQFPNAPASSPGGFQFRLLV